jgi:hypothetical protein
MTILALVGITAPILFTALTRSRYNFTSEATRQFLPFRKSQAPYIRRNRLRKPKYVASRIFDANAQVRLLFFRAP